MRKKSLNDKIVEAERLRSKGSQRFDDDVIQKYSQKQDLTDLQRPGLKLIKGER